MSKYSTVLAAWLVCALAGAPAFAQGAGELTERARTLLEQIEAKRGEVRELRAQRDGLEGEERLLAERRLLRRAMETLDDLDALVDNVLAQEKRGLDATEFREPAESLVQLLAPLVRTRVDTLREEIAQLSTRRQTTTGEALIKLEDQLKELNRELVTVLRAALDNAEHMEQLGLDASAERDYLVQTLSEKAESDAERFRLSVEQTKALATRVQAKPDDADLATELSALRAKQEVTQHSLTATIAMMERLELKTAEYHKLLIQGTGQITSEILDKEVAVGLFQQWTERATTWVVDNGPRFVFKGLIFLVILLMFRLLARVVRRLVARAVAASKLNLSQLLQKMVVSVSGNLVLGIGLLVALSQLGFALGPILAGLGIVGFILGFALQDTIGNFAAGLMILIYRPYDVDDMIDAAGVFGRVSAMSMVSTTVLTIDNQTLIIPNGKIWGDVIKNVTAQRIRRVDMTFGVSYEDDVARTEHVLAQILAEHPKVLKYPDPVIKLHSLGDSSVDFVVRPWVKTDDYWDVYWDVTREVKMRFDREGIHIPFPQRDVHLYEQKRSAGIATGGEVGVE
ncbi:MAG TPA: mechanosensitive ion channel domain-containing protein [Candidatus Polarisedimenticolaceae bacterium]|nr:mechanosensitive ion channel domain-containing protein [Candidatus Polarisedimenticolaceae bacterium]